MGYVRLLAAEGVMTPPIDLESARLQAELDAAEFAVFAVGETRRYGVEKRRE